MSVATRSVPPALASSNEFEQLNSKQVANFSARLSYVEEVIEGIRVFLSAGEGREPLRDFLDTLELDTTSANVFSTNADEHQSNYLTHSSWTFECAPEELAKEVGRELLGIRATQDLVQATSEETESWLADLSNGLTLAIGRFYAASSFCAAVAHLLLIDALMAELLAGLIRLRFNARIKS
jgi:hypothetical protein